MPVTLRGINNPAADYALLPALAKILRGYPTPNTNLAAQDSVNGTGDASIYINNHEAMLAPGALFPAVHLSLGKPMRSVVQSLRSRVIPSIPILIEYYDTWTETTRIFDAIWTAIGEDLYRMLANVEDNQTIAIGGVTYADGMPAYEIEQYVGREFHTVPGGAPGLTLVRRTASIGLQQLGYTTGS